MIDVATVKLPPTLWDFPRNRADLAAAAAARSKANGTPLEPDEVRSLLLLQDDADELTRLLVVVEGSDDPVEALQNELAGTS